MADAVILEGLERAATIVSNDVSHGAVGTGTVAPDLSDTQLGTETNRVATTKRVVQANAFQTRFFFPNGSLPTTLEELGAFMNGSAAANSGSMLVRGTQSFTKGSQDLLVIVEVVLEEGDPP